MGFTLSGTASADQLVVLEVDWHNGPLASGEVVGPTGSNGRLQTAWTQVAAPLRRPAPAPSRMGSLSVAHPIGRCESFRVQPT